jgi:hypothetical protein
MEPKNQIESELNSAVRNNKEKSSGAVRVNELPHVKLAAQFLTDEITSHRVPHA